MPVPNKGGRTCDYGNRHLLARGLLYKLLTGECAHKFGSDSASAIALTISGGKIIPPSKLAPEIKSDLEFMLMKGRAASRRIAIRPSINSPKIENFLESRPIRARKGHAWYHTRKYVRRHWFPVAAASLAVAGLSTGLVFANRERNVAQRRFVEVRQLANKLFEIDLEVRKVPVNTKARQQIVDTSLEYLRRLSFDPHGDPDLALELRNAYMRVARVQGVSIASNFGQLDQADQNLQLAEKLVGSWEMTRSVSAALKKRCLSCSTLSKSPTSSLIKMPAIPTVEAVWQHWCTKLF